MIGSGIMSKKLVEIKNLTIKSTKLIRSYLLNLTETVLPFTAWSRAM